MWNSLQDELRTAPYTVKHFVSQITEITFDTCSCFYAVHGFFLLSKLVVYHIINPTLFFSQLPKV